MIFPIRSTAVFCPTTTTTTTTIKWKNTNDLCGKGAENEEKDPKMPRPTVVRIVEHVDVPAPPDVFVNEEQSGLRRTPF